MRRSALAAALAAALLIAPVAFAAGSLTVRGDLHVTGTTTLDQVLTVGGPAFVRSVQANTSSEISNFGTLFASQAMADRLTINAGGYGLDWIDGTTTTSTSLTRIVAGAFGSPPTVDLPASSLLITRLPDGTAELWFKTGPLATDWVRLTP